MDTQWSEKKLIQKNKLASQFEFGFGTTVFISCLILNVHSCIAKELFQIQFQIMSFRSLRKFTKSKSTPSIRIVYFNFEFYENNQAFSGKIILPHLFLHFPFSTGESIYYCTNVIITLYLKHVF